MMKPAICIALLLTGMLVFSVFQVEKQVQSLRDELWRLNRQMAADRNAAHVLQAEWSYLNKPERLKDMAEKYLDLHYVAAGQVRDIDHIPFRNVMVVSYSAEEKSSQ